MAAAAISLAIVSSRCSQPTLFQDKLFLRSSSEARQLFLPSSSVLLSHAIKKAAPAARRVNSIRCRVYPPGDVKHWFIYMEKPCGKYATKQQMIDCCIQTLKKVVGRKKVDPQFHTNNLSEKEAKQKFHHHWLGETFGFLYEIDEETSKKLKALPGVLDVLPCRY